MDKLTILLLVLLGIGVGMTLGLAIWRTGVAERREYDPRETSWGGQ